MIAILLKYICICLIFTFIFGLIVLDDTDRWYEFIIKILIMPFIVIGSFIIVTIDDLKNVSGIGDKKFESMKEYVSVK